MVLRPGQNSAGLGPWLATSSAQLHASQPPFSPLGMWGPCRVTLALGRGISNRERLKVWLPFEALRCENWQLCSLPFVYEPRHKTIPRLLNWCCIANGCPCRYEKLSCNDWLCYTATLALGKHSPLFRFPSAVSECWQKQHLDCRLQGFGGL